MTTRTACAESLSATGTSDRCDHMNHMIHNITPSPTEVYITYELAFIPADSPRRRGSSGIETALLDTVGGFAYPVFDAKRGAGAASDRRFTYPDEAGDVPRLRGLVPEDGAMVGTGGHLHPGGLWTDLSRRATAARRACSARRRSTSSRRAPSRGTSR